MAKIRDYTKAERNYFSKRTFRDIYSKEELWSKDTLIEWKIVLEFITKVIDKNYFSEKLFKTARFKINIKVVHDRKFYTYRPKLEVDHKLNRQYLLHCIAIDARILEVNNSNFGDKKQGIIHILIRALCEIEAKAWAMQTAPDVYNLISSRKEMVKVTDKREGGGAEKDREAHRKISKKIRNDIKKAPPEPVKPLRHNKTEKISQFTQNDPLPQKYVLSKKETQTYLREWKQFMFIRLREICGYVPSSITFPSQNKREGVFCYCPATLSVQRRK